MNFRHATTVAIMAVLVAETASPLLPQWYCVIAMDVSDNILIWNIVVKGIFTTKVDSIDIDERWSS